MTSLCSLVSHSWESAPVAAVRQGHKFIAYEWRKKEGQGAEKEGKRVRGDA